MTPKNFLSLALVSAAAVAFLAAPAPLAVAAGPADPAIGAAPAQAGYLQAQAQTIAARRQRRVAPAPVIKDCTRINGRYGYYGNPWCTEAEQLAFDRATSRPRR